MIDFQKIKGIKTPFELNNEQKKALLSLEDFILNPAKYNNQITLLGYAGTGKTSIIGIFYEYLLRIGRVPVFSSPTHRANAVTKLKNPKANVYTLHSLFGLSGEINLEDEDYDLTELEFKQNSKMKIQVNDILIVDESSMVSKVLERFLSEAKKQLNLKIIYVGDPAQLKPVKEEDISVVFRTGVQIQLTKVERTGDNAILEESTNLRNGLDFNYKTKMKGEIGGVEYISSHEEIYECIEENFNSKEFEKNKLFFRILCAKNKFVQMLNEIARTNIYKEKASEQILPGEILMGYDNFQVDFKTKEPKIINSGDYFVVSVLKTKKEVLLPESKEFLEFNGFNVVLENILTSDMDLKSIFIIDKTEDREKINSFVKEISDLNIIGAKLLQKANNTFDKTEQKKLRQQAAINFGRSNDLKNEIAFMENIVDKNAKIKVKKTLDYGYSHSVHKCLSGESKIFTLNGLKLLKNINIGDFVNTGNGFYKKVLNKFYSGQKQNFRIITKCGYELNSSKDHFILNKNFEFDKADNFKIGDFLPIPRKLISEPNINLNNITIDYLIGYIVGDGSYNNNNRIDITFGGLETQIFSYVQNFLNSLKEQKITNNFSFNTYNKGNCFDLVIDNKEFRKYLVELGLTHNSGGNKKIPIYIFEKSLQEKSNFLRGLFDADGCAMKRRVVYVTQCKSIVQDVQKLLLEFGIISYFTKQRNAYYLYITSDNVEKYKKYISFSVDRKREILNSFPVKGKPNNDFIPHKERFFAIYSDNKTKHIFGDRKHLNYNFLKKVKINDKFFKEVLEKEYFFDEIIFCEQTDEIIETYDLEVEDIHQFVSDGLIVHNSQGGTYNKILILGNTISKPFDPQTIQQLKYVAMSRASEYVYVHSN